MSYQVAVKSALETDATLATVAMAILRKEFGDDFYHWDPSTIYLEIRDQFKAEPSTSVMDRLSAVQIALTTDGFFNQIDAFLNICNTLASGSPAFSSFDPVEVEEVAWALTEISFLRDMLPFGGTVVAYVRHILEADGYDNHDFPPIFDYVLGAREQGQEPQDLLERTLHDDKKDNVDMFITEQLKDMVHQFNEIPGMGDVLNQLLDEKELEDII
jgi:hypothetical protein